MRKSRRTNEIRGDQHFGRGARPLWAPPNATGLPRRGIKLEGGSLPTTLSTVILNIYDLVFKCRYERFRVSPLVAKYPNFREHVTEMYIKRKEKWCLAFRNGLVTGGSSMRLLEYQVCVSCMVGPTLIGGREDGGGGGDYQHF